MRSAQLAGLPGNQGLWVQGAGWRPCLRAQSPGSSRQCLGTEVWTQLELMARSSLRLAPAGHSILELGSGPAPESGVERSQCWAWSSLTVLTCGAKCTAQLWVSRSGLCPQGLGSPFFLVTPGLSKALGPPVNPKQEYHTLEGGRGEGSVPSLEDRIEAQGHKAPAPERGLRQWPCAHSPSPDCPVCFFKQEGNQTPELGAGGPSSTCSPTHTSQATSHAPKGRILLKCPERRFRRSES